MPVHLHHSSGVPLHQNLFHILAFVPSHRKRQKKPHAPVDHAAECVVSTSSGEG